MLSPSLAASKYRTFSALIDSEADCAGLSAALVICVTALASKLNRVTITNSVDSSECLKIDIVPSLFIDAKSGK